MPRKSRHEEDEDMEDDEPAKGRAPKDDDDDEDDDDDAISLYEAEEEEDDDDDDEDDDEEDEEKAVVSVEEMERRKVFQSEAEEIMEHLTLDDIKEVLEENELETSLATKLRKCLVQVINEGEAVSMDEVWEEALERLED